MEHYYFNNNVDANGKHEIHIKDCSSSPYVLNRTYIGYYSSCDEALQKAKSLYPLKSFDSCYWCCRDCHEG